MIVCRALIHLMLCTSLILSGSGLALAGEFMHAQGHHADAAAMQMQHDMAENCAEAMTGPAHVEAMAAHDHSKGQPASSPDCCQSANACDCACQQHSPVTTSTAIAYAVAVGDTRVLPPSKVGHPAPRPSRQIRPPIA